MRRSELNFFLFFLFIFCINSQDGVGYKFLRKMWELEEEWAKRVSIQELVDGWAKKEEAESWELIMQEL